jgi:N,N'-diacetyllegionaminate synthase
MDPLHLSDGVVMKIGSIDIQSKVIIVAEIGNNHEGDAEVARKMVWEAAAAGADAVKFQTIIPTRLVSADQQERLVQLGRFQLSQEDHAMLAAEATEAGMVFLTTPFDIDAVDWLDALVPAYKVSSGDNDFFPLLERLARTGKPVIVSLGLGGAQHASKLVDFFGETWRKYGVEDGALALLHCVSAYPTPEGGASLGILHQLGNLGVTVGYSDHTLGVKAAELAVAAGARIIEKHFTLDKAQSAFRDHQLSADPVEMRALVAAVRRAEQLFKITEGISADENNKQPVRRSIAAARDLPEGTILQWEDLVWVRPGTGLRPGEEERVLDHRVQNPILAGHLILPEDLV